MSKGDNSPGVSKLAAAMRNISEGTRDNSLIIDYGVIQADKSLLTNSYPIAVPRSDYLICRHLKSRSVSASTVSLGADDDESHAHSITINTREQIKVGDRVLVVWVHNDPIVVDVILEAKDVI